MFKKQTNTQTNRKQRSWSEFLSDCTSFPAKVAFSLFFVPSALKKMIHFSLVGSFISFLWFKKCPRPLNPRALAIIILTDPIFNICLTSIFYYLLSPFAMIFSSLLDQVYIVV